MADIQSRQPPSSSVERDQFYAGDERRRHSHVLSYGSAWQDPDWTGDHSHVIELMWFGHTHELVALYLLYDWSRLAPGEIRRDALQNEVEQVASIDSGAAIGRYLADVDLATVDCWMDVLAVLPGALHCHELLWDWRWIQHHPDGLRHVKQRISERAGS